MNIEILARPGTTRAAEGLPRRRFTVAELERMVEAGILLEDERIELIGGEVVPMSPKGNRHEVVKTMLLDHWYRSRPEHLLLTPETTIRLDENTYLEPDIVIYELSVGLEGLNGDTALLAVEIADSSLAYDLGRKAEIYASFGIRELWVIDAVKLTTRIHLQPGDEDYKNVSDHGPDDELIPAFAPHFAVTLGKLDL